MREDSAQSPPKGLCSLPVEILDKVLENVPAKKIVLTCSYNDTTPNKCYDVSCTETPGKMPELRSLALTCQHLSQVIPKTAAFRRDGTGSEVAKIIEFESIPDKRYPVSYSFGCRAYQVYYWDHFWQPTTSMRPSAGEKSKPCPQYSKVPPADNITTVIFNRLAAGYFGSSIIYNFPNLETIHLREYKTDVSEKCHDQLSAAHGLGKFAALGADERKRDNYSLARASAVVSEFISSIVAGKHAHDAQSIYDVPQDLEDREDYDPEEYDRLPAWPLPNETREQIKDKYRWIVELEHCPCVSDSMRADGILAADGIASPEALREYQQAHPNVMNIRVKVDLSAKRVFEAEFFTW
ncbi:uncharacterized protein AB675_4464 [Cyphellophora attinorum]|uniref:Uncharacterized protein n=1 Tax=Cyphellophora attinorum TaxID=1664694 RepID=A0A0N1H7R0_9EURO|nr:uncharacterized protein AB675_4464 [Phialophora attinorum]KPI39137.1 hypothetical protein AB675_4464 [Phialophora attinorum]